MILVVEFIFLFIVFPVSENLYIFFIFLHGKQSIVSLLFFEFFRGLCPRPASGIKGGFSGNNTNADGIKGGTGQTYLLPLSRLFTDVWSAGPRTVRSAGSAPDPSYGISASIS